MISASSSSSMSLSSIPFLSQAVDTVFCAISLLVPAFSLSPFFRSHFSRTAAQGLGRNRLGDIVIHSRLQAQFPVALHGVGGHGDNGNMMISDCGSGIADPAGRLHSVHFRHLHIHEDEIVGEDLQRLQRLRAVGNGIGGFNPSFFNIPMATCWLVILSSASRMRTLVPRKRSIISRAAGRVLPEGADAAPLVQSGLAVQGTGHP